MASKEQAVLAPLGVNGLKQAASVRNQYHIIATEGTKPEDLIAPTYWRHVARLMRVGDKIEVMVVDASWYAELRVMEVGKTESFGARVAFTLKPVSLANQHVLAQLNDYESRPSGSGWQVFKRGQSEPVKKDLPDKNAADKWISSQRRAMAA